jgi:hypothetical protein
LKPQRIQLSRRKGWRMPADTIKVDRSTKWGNPFVVGTHGTQVQCVELYRSLVGGAPSPSLANIAEQQAAYAWVRDHREQLRGRNLACWCRIGSSCHADVLIEIVNSPAPTS